MAVRTTCKLAAMDFIAVKPPLDHHHVMISSSSCRLQVWQCLYKHIHDPIPRTTNQLVLKFINRNAFSDLQSSSGYRISNGHDHLQIHSSSGYYSWKRRRRDVRVYADVGDPVLDVRVQRLQEQTIDHDEQLVLLGEDDDDIVLRDEVNGWRVRRVVRYEDEEELKRVACIQTQAFYSPLPNYLTMPFFISDFFYEMFKADVLFSLRYKIRNFPRDRYACLGAESTSAEPDHEVVTHQQHCSRKIVGVVDLTFLRDEQVAQHLQGADEYLYISGIAVLREFRRKKVATTLLKACDVMSFKWDVEYLALWAYEDDQGARRLYASAGYKVVSRDPLWMTTWIGRKRRVLMIKKRTV